MGEVATSQTTTESILPITDWHYPTDSGGVVRFDDGTVWVFMLGINMDLQIYNSFMRTYIIFTSQNQYF